MTEVDIAAAEDDVLDDVNENDMVEFVDEDNVAEVVLDSMLEVVVLESELKLTEVKFTDDGLGEIPDSPVTELGCLLPDIEYVELEVNMLMVEDVPELVALVDTLLDVILELDSMVLEFTV